MLILAKNLLPTFALFLLTAPALVMGQDISESPLPSCPDTPNCEHQVHTFDLASSALTDHVIAALKDMDAESIDVEQLDTIQAVFKIWKYRDDVSVAVQPNGDQSTLFVRSASREGYSDLGVNRRRVKRFMKTLNKSIKQDK